jgi:hypothetical protein
MWVVGAEETMADLIARVTSTGPHAPLAGLVTS